MLDNAYYMRIAQQIAFYTIAAIGLNLLVGYQGQVSFGHGGLFAIGAYASALLATRLGSPVWLCMIVGAPRSPGWSARSWPSRPSARRAHTWRW